MLAVKQCFTELKKVITCNICLDFYLNPCTLDSCGHSFCRECIERCKSFRESCPICSVPFSTRDIAPAGSIAAAIAGIASLVKSIETRNGLNMNPSLPTPDVSTTRDCLSSQSATPAVEADSVLFRVGDIVNVLPRTWPGMNKLGGSARIISSNSDESYNVRYILDGGQDHNVPVAFIERMEPLTRGSRKRQTPELLSPGVSASSPAKRSPLRDINESSLNSRSQASSASKSTTYSSSQKQPKRPSKPMLPKRLLDRTSSGAITEQSQPRESRKILFPVRAGGTNSSSSSISGGGSSGTFRRERTLGSSCVLLASGLSTEQLAELEKFVLRFHARIATHFDDTVTHLVVSTDDCGVFRQRTMKYLQSIIAGIWIVSFEWIEENLSKKRKKEKYLPISDQQSSTEGGFGERSQPADVDVTGLHSQYRERSNATGIAIRSDRSASPALSTPMNISTVELLGEEDYEVVSCGKAVELNAPYRARLQRYRFNEGKESKLLFSEFSVLFSGSFPNPGPARSDLALLVTIGDGKAFYSLNEFESSSNYKVVICGDTTSEELLSKELVSRGYIDVTDTSDYAELKLPEIRFAYVPRAAHQNIIASGQSSLPIVVAAPNWLLDCVTNYSVDEFLAAITSIQ